MRSEFRHRRDFLLRRRFASVGGNPFTAYAVEGAAPKVVADLTAEKYAHGGAFVAGFSDLLTFARSGTATYVDANGVLQTAADGVARVGHHRWNGSAWVNKGLLLETAARTNDLLNSGTLSTQNVTVTADRYVLHFTGSGSITLSGTSTAGPLNGTGSGEANRVELAFTPSAGTLTLTVAGTVTNAQLEKTTGQRSSYIPTTSAAVTRAAETLTIAAAKMAYSATAMCFQMEGEMDYADTGTFELYFYLWFKDATASLDAFLDASGASTGQVTFRQEASSTVDSVVSAADAYSPGLNVAFNIASRHGSTFVNGAIDGAALTANTTPTALPDLSTTDFKFGTSSSGAILFMGTIALFRQWDVDLGDAGIEAATA